MSEQLKQQLAERKRQHREDEAIEQLFAVLYGYLPPVDAGVLAGIILRDTEIPAARA
jgi:hypothetical protein